LPNAALKIYLTASVEERARRRFVETKGTANEVPFDQLLKDIAARDFADMNREISPLVIAPGAIEVDSTAMSMQEVVSCFYDLATTELARSKQCDLCIPSRDSSHTVCRFVPLKSGRR
jgi:cytidylate kinase